jgi:flagellar biosynthesis protein
MNNIEKKTDRSAVSLRYDNRVNKSPVVTAKGRGLIADKIISLAKENNVPIKEDPDLVHLLSKVDLNREIPASLYQVVAELLSFVYKLNGEYSSRVK